MIAKGYQMNDIPRQINLGIAFNDREGKRKTETVHCPLCNSDVGFDMLSYPPGKGIAHVQCQIDPKHKFNIKMKDGKIARELL